MKTEEPSTASPGQEKSRQWSGRTRGGYFGNWFFVQLVRRLGLRPAYAWLVFVAGYFTLVAGKSRRCSVEYLRQVIPGHSRWKRPFLVFRHFYSFGVTLLDRMALIMGTARFGFRFEGELLFRDYLEQGKGVILLGAHVGSWEIGGHLLDHLGKPVNLVVLEKEEQRLRELFDDALADRKFRLIATDGSPLRSVPILAALRRGEIVALLGDRAFGGGECRVPFLGRPARFPTGPYLLAAATGAPLFQVFSVRERLGHYRFFTYPPRLVPRTLLRGPPEELRSYVEEFAERLANTVRQYPFQWYNIYPFWD
jgi:predicted LPLAT superfamily acyltransferase